MLQPRPPLAVGRATILRSVSVTYCLPLCLFLFLHVQVHGNFNLIPHNSTQQQHSRSSDELGA